MEENFDQLLAEERSKYAEHPEMKEGLEPGAMKTQFGCMFFFLQKFIILESIEIVERLGCTYIFP